MAKKSDEKDRLDHLITPRFSNRKRSFEVRGGHLTISVDSGDRDDCAVVDSFGELSLVFGSDYVRGPKFALFELGLLSHYDIGYYLSVANISDIAAMGAIPVGLLTVIRYPNDMTDDDFGSVIAGIDDAAQKYGAEVIGGDIGSAERLILSASAFGFCEKGRALRRNSAQVGDLICVTGPVGTPGAAVLYFTERQRHNLSLEKDLEDQLLASWRRPEARVREGRLLIDSPHVHACMDISDGLKASLEELSERSGCGVEVVKSDLPFEPSVKAVAEALRVDPTALALSASVDFELLFTVAEDGIARLRRAFENEGLSFTIVGRVTPPVGLSLVSEGARSEVPGFTWRHQSGDIGDIVLEALKG